MSRASRKSQRGQSRSRTPDAAQIRPELNRYEFFAPGHPEPYALRAGRGRAWLPDKLKIWKGVFVLWAGHEIPDTPIVGPVRLTLDFYLKRPKSVKSARPVTRPDATSLQRPVEDCLTGSYFMDDSQVVEITTRKHYASESFPEGVHIVVEAL